MDASKQVPIIYNLFPRLAGPLPDWLPHAARAADMGFNWIYVNSFHYPGFSGSLYAVKYYRRLNPMFMPPGAAGRGLLDLRRTLHRLRDLGL
ncbi:MAG: alpha-amylase, partial [Dehalococcoidia bacterium]